MRRILFLTGLALLSCRTTSVVEKPTTVVQSAPKKPEIHLTVIGTNDVHGWVMPQLVSVNKTDLTVGGSAMLASYIELLRKENPNGVVLLDGGDMFQGTLASNLSEGSVVIDAMNAMGYDAAAVGNHEFDFGPVGTGPESNVPNADRLGALKQRIAQAKFPILATNIYEGGNVHPTWISTKGTTMFVRNGVKIGVVGLSTLETPMTTNPENIKTLSFSPLAAETMRAAAELRAQGAELVFAVAHVGGVCQKREDPSDISSCDVKTGEIFKWLNAMPAGTLDLVIAGHTHHALGHIVNGTVVIETPGMGKSFGYVELTLDGDTRKVESAKTQIHSSVPLCQTMDLATASCEPAKIGQSANVQPVAAMWHGQPVVPNATLTPIVQLAMQQVEQIQKKALGVTLKETLVRTYYGESALGSTLADALRGEEHADIAILNPGGLRADLRAGSLTYGDLFEVMPFDNTISTVTVTGEELKRLAGTMYESRKGVFQVSGLEVEIVNCGDQRRLKKVTLKGGKPIVMTKKYKVALPDFLAKGGDGFDKFTQTIDVARIDMGTTRPINMRDALVGYLQKKGAKLEVPALGRIRMASDTSWCASATQ